MKPERNIQKSWNLSAKNCLAEALITMMQTENIENIHIKDLVQKAGVSRMSYYRYFSSKKEILTYYMDYILKEYEHTVEKNAKHFFQSYDHISESLIFFRNYKDFALCLERSHLSYILMDSLNAYIERQQGFDAEKAVRSYPFYYYAGALYNIYMQWIKTDTKETPEKLATIIYQLTPNTAMVSKQTR